MWARVRQTTTRAIGVVDVALWDIAGKVAGLPIHKLMGAYRDRVPAYASSEVLPSASAYAEQAVQFKEAGWAAYKIHPPQRLRDDIAACEAVRRAVGDDYTVMLDSTWGYDYPTALRVGRAVEEMNYYWYEDPSPTRTSTTTSSCARPCASRSWRRSTRWPGSIPMRSG